jgi:bla regulator protein BlaR1
MPALFVFLLKVNIALLIFCLGYYLVLRRLTFYTLNRVYLGVAIIFSSVYPLINVNSFVERHHIPVSNTIVNWKAPAVNFVEPIIQQPGYWLWAEMIFWIGAALFAMRLMIQLLSLYKLYKNSKPGKIQDHEVRIIDADISPFSFWQSIYINPANLNPGDLESVLQHEQVHVKEWHTMDILLTEISVIFYWFNPGIWLMKKAVRENIEFITDRKILQKGTDSKAYQYSLLNVSFTATASAGITNHFNFSTLKKRIKMMNAKRSANVNLTRYAFLLPAVLICLFAFSISKAELVKKSKIAYKAITASVNNLITVTTANHTHSAAAKKSAQKTTAIDTDKKQFIVESNYNYKITDTGKHKIIMLSTVNYKIDTNKKLTLKIVRKNDSVSWYIDGKKASKEEFEKVNPNDIESFYVLKDPGPDGIITVQTKGTHNVAVLGKTATELPLHNVIIKRFNDTSKNQTYYSGKLTTEPTTSNVVITGSDGTNIKTSKIQFKLLHDEPNIDNFSDKLVIIDGKEATEKDMKKLPASDIQSINVHNGKTMTDKYGDKAKNGVLFITTKKNNK